MIKTIPPWHNYTGPSRKSRDYSLPPVTCLDAISKAHDRAVKSKTVIGAFGTSEQSQAAIDADWQFIKSYLWYVVNIPTDLIAGAIGVLIFIVNIGLNKINLWRNHD